MFQQFILNGLIVGAVYAFVALSFVLIYSVARFFHFAHGAVCVIAAYGCYAFSVIVGQPLWVAIPLALVLAAGVGAAFEVGIYRPLRRQGASPLGLLLASLGAYIVLENTIAMFFGNETRTIRGGAVLPGNAVLGGRITSLQISTIVVSLLGFVATWMVIRFTTSGRKFRAVADDPELASIVGIRADAVSVATFVGGSAIAGLAAVLFALDVGMKPTMGLTLLLPAVAAVIVGGINSIGGALLGGMLVGLAQHVALLWIGSEWQDTVAFVILAIFLLFRPRGFLGRPSQARRE